MPIITFYILKDLNTSVKCSFTQLQTLIKYTKFRFFTPQTSCVIRCNKTHDVIRENVFIVEISFEYFKLSSFIIISVVISVQIDDKFKFFGAFLKKLKNKKI